MNAPPREHLSRKSDLERRRALKAPSNYQVEVLMWYRMAAYVQCFPREMFHADINVPSSVKSVP